MYIKRDKLKRLANFCTFSCFLMANSLVKSTTEDVLLLCCSNLIYQENPVNLM